MTRRIILVDIGAGLTLAGVLPSVALFADYSAQLKARGGQAPYTYTVTTGAAELTAAGLQLDPATGIISGTAGMAGTIAITVRVTDLSGAYVERGFIVTVIAEPLSLSGAAPLWTVGTPYSYTYTAAHGVPPYTWSIASGSLPAGLTLGATGEISGTPTAGNAPAWTVRVTDSAGTHIDLRDNTTLQLLGDFADATIGTTYSSDLLINGGYAPYSNPRVTVGALPAGLALSVVGDKLRLSGTPTAVATSSFTVAVDSADVQTATSAQSVSAVHGYLDALAVSPRSAYSLRKVISTATRSIRVRRGSDNAESDIGFAGTSLDVASLVSFAGGGDAFVAKLYDQTATGNDAVQATATAQPRIVSAGTFGGEITFNGTSSWLSTGVVAMGTPYFGAAMKIRCPNASGFHHIFGLGTDLVNNAQSALIGMEDNSIRLYSQNGVGTHNRVHSYTVDASALSTITALMDRTVIGTGEVAMYFNGTFVPPAVVYALDDQTGNYASLASYIGHRPSTSIYCAMGVETFVVYSADMSSVRSQIEGVIA